MSKLYTIGYANKAITDFISILKNKGINLLIDVRSMPYSKQYPDYNENKIALVLKKENILYYNLKDEFGARRIEDEVYRRIEMYDGKEIDVVDFDEVYKLDIFQQGVKKIVTANERGFRVCFMCSEKYAFDCHRGIMIAEYFYQQGFQIEHIVDKSNTFMHNDIELYLKENFEKCKLRFKKENANDLRKAMYEGDLFGGISINSNLEKWNEFFNDYSRKKAFILRNYEIGYKKGNDEND